MGVLQTIGRNILFPNAQMVTCNNKREMGFNQMAFLTPGIKYSLERLELENIIISKLNLNKTLEVVENWDGGWAGG